jgi:hypothetical protein
VVVIHTDLPEELELDVKFAPASATVPLATLAYVGIPVETFWTHAVTSAVGPNPATDQPPSLTDSAVTDWSSATAFGRFRIVGGTRDGAIGWPVRQHPTTLTEMRTSSFGTSTGPFFTEVVPVGGVGGDTYTAERIPRVHGANIHLSCLSGSVTFESIAFLPPQPTFRTQFLGNVGYILRYCMVSSVNLFASFMNIINCKIGANELTSITLSGTFIGVLGGTAPFRGILIARGADVQLTQNTIIWGNTGGFATAGLVVEGRGNVGGVGFFEHGTAIAVASGGVLRTGTVYGSGNTPTAILIDAGGSQKYDVLPSIGITTATAETRVGGVDKFYTDLPFFNTANGAALVIQP